MLLPMSSWQDSRRDSKPTRFSSQLWQVRSFAAGPAAPLGPRHPSEPKSEVHLFSVAVSRGDLTFIPSLLIQPTASTLQGWSAGCTTANA